MKKRFFLTVAVVFAVMTSSAQDVFNHMGVGVNVGTTGVGVDLRLPITKWVTFRPGFNYFPNVKYTTDIGISVPSEAAQAGIKVPTRIDVEGKTSLTTGQVLFDVNPFSFPLHLTVGAYFGGSKVIKVNNKDAGALSAVTEWNRMNPNYQVGAKLGDYLLTPDAQGNVNAWIETATFRPYVGIGWGSGIPSKAVNFNVELGCQFWGSPKVYCNDTELQEDHVGDSSEGGIIKTISKVTVYPTLKFALGFRVF